MTGPDMQMMIWPGMTRVYRLVLVIDVQGGDYETVSEHDSMDEAVSAMRRAERACADAALALQGAFA